MWPSIWTNRDKTVFFFFYLQHTMAANKRETDNSSNSLVGMSHREQLLGESQWLAAGSEGKLRCYMEILNFNHFHLSISPPPPQPIKRGGWSNELDTFTNFAVCQNQWKLSPQPAPHGSPHLERLTQPKSLFHVSVLKETLLLVQRAKRK